MADAMTQQSTKPIDDPNADPNLAIKKQLTDATPQGSDQPMIPPPPPLPTTPGTPTPRAANDVNGSIADPSQTLMPPPPPPSVDAAPPASTGYGGTGKYGNLSYADAVQAKYRDDQAQQAARGVEMAPQDYSQAGLTDSGAWGMSGADQAANAARTASIQSDSTSTAAAKSLAGLTGYGTANFDRSLNNGSNPALAGQVSALLNQSASQRTSSPSPVSPPVVSGAFPGAFPDGASMSTQTLGAGGAGGGASATAAPPLSPRAAIGAPPAGPATDAGSPSVPGGLPSLSAAAPIGAAANGAAANGAPSSPYTDANVQIDSTVLPNTDPRLSGTQSMLDTASKSLANVDRTKLAEDMFGQFSEATDPAYNLALRRATQSAAGAGRIGSGQLRTSYGDLANQRAQQLDLAKRGFMSDALNGSIADQFNKVNALSGLEGQQFGEGASNRNELRGERGYQGSLEEQAFQRALTQYQLQQQGQQQQFNNGLALTNVGESGNPSGAYAQMAAQLGVDPSVIMQLANSLGKNSVGGGTQSNGGYSIPQIPKLPGIPSFPGGTAPYIDGSSYPSGQYVG